MLSCTQPRTTTLYTSAPPSHMSPPIFSQSSEGGLRRNKLCLFEAPGSQEARSLSHPPANSLLQISDKHHSSALPRCLSRVRRRASSERGTPNGPAPLKLDAHVRRQTTTPSPSGRNRSPLVGCIIAEALLIIIQVSPLEVDRRFGLVFHFSLLVFHFLFTICRTSSPSPF